MTRTIRQITALLLAFLILLPLTGCGQQESRREEMRDKIFDFVLKRRNSLDNNGGLYRKYDAFAEPDGWVEFGYLYQEESKYTTLDNGYGFGPVSNDKTTGNYYYDRGVRRETYGEWEYREKICNNWYYYEIHLD